MYDWLAEALADEDATVVTVNRRLARALHEAHGRQQAAAGLAAWRRPSIVAVQDWYHQLYDSVAHAVGPRVRIGAAQSRVLWEQCLERDLDDPLLNTTQLARLCRDAWNRLAEWNVPLDECQSRALGQDQRIFARAAGHYTKALHDRHWVDDAGLVDVLSEMLGRGTLQLPRRITLAGFDRVTPRLKSLLEHAGRDGAGVRTIPAGETPVRIVSRFDNADAELRAAGAWARERIEREPGASVAIVTANLDQVADRAARLIREGLVPGWQYGGPDVAGLLDVSYGRRLSEYPAIHSALEILRWSHAELSSREVALLLRSPFIGTADATGRSRLELRLRDWPERRWTRQMLVDALDGLEDKADAKDWLARIGRMDELLGEQKLRSPAQWARCFDEILNSLGWPGEGALGSSDFQLDNRWRDLLNEFARLALVIPSVDVAQALGRIRTMAGEVVFQPELRPATVALLGPLEAAGLEFDYLWIAGLTSADWPPAAHPLVLVSLDLQREHALPDATPEDTEDHARKILRRLAGGAGRLRLSFPAALGDAEQIPTGLFGELEVAGGEADPGWHANALANRRKLEPVPDRKPEKPRGETLYGGARTIDRLAQDPFSAFAFGRLAIRWLPPFKSGITPPVRGNLVHDALACLYDGLPTRDALRAWSGEELRRRIDRAAGAAFRRHERHADRRLHELLALERVRTRRLLEEVVAVDSSRDEFRVVDVERDLKIELAGLVLSLRLDRIDQLDDGGIAIIDYKTGAARRLLTKGEPSDLQLVVYSRALDASVAGLALFNVDSRQVQVDGAGPAFGDGDDWNHRLRDWQQAVNSAAVRIAAGEIRLNIAQSSQDARPLALLSRYAELRREH